jgi:hypothetical protein
MITESERLIEREVAQEATLWGAKTVYAIKPSAEQRGIYFKFISKPITRGQGIVESQIY